jgi:MscS family membrane protein
MRIFWRMLFSALLICFGAEVFAQAATNVVVVTNAPATNRIPLLTLTDEQINQLTFGLDKISALQYTFLGIELWQYVASLIYIFLAFAVSKILDYLVRNQLKRWTARTKTKLDDLLVELAGGPIKIISFVVFLHIGLQVFKWPSWLEIWISRGLQLVVAISLTYMLLRLVDILIHHWRRRAATRDDKTFNDQLFPIISKTLKVFVVIIAVLVTSQNLGLNITGVLASLSIGGLALGLAAQDTVANLFGAVAVFADKPFQIGDTIKLESIEGTVETIGLRSTRIRNPDGHLITVPNKTMGNATITNITRRPAIRTVMDLGLTYDTSPAKMRRAVEILKEVYGSHPQTKDLIVAFNQFAASALNIRVIHQWGGLDYKAYMAGMQELNLIVQEKFEAEKISFAFPTQTLYMKQDSPWNLSIQGDAALLQKADG